MVYSALPEPHAALKDEELLCQFQSRISNLPIHRSYRLYKHPAQIPNASDHVNSC